MLWNRSLVMMDQETKSLWSHLLGEAMSGQLKGAQLDSLPSDMVTWQAWRREHPETTVLNLPRTHRAYTKEFYRQPESFVYAFEADGQFYHCSFSTMLRQPLIGFETADSKLLLSFDSESTSAKLYSRKIDGRELSFTPVDRVTVRDRQTGSTWRRASGVSTQGPLAGKKLDHLPGIVSFARAWEIFHPDSKEITAPDPVPE